MSRKKPDDIAVETLAETPHYVVWKAEEPDGEVTYHVELGPVTAHFFTEEWQEFVALMREAQQEHGEDEDVEVEMDWGTLIFEPEEWTEFVQLLGQL